jgi:hypothetical protein
MGFKLFKGRQEDRSTFLQPPPSSKNIVCHAPKGVTQGALTAVDGKRYVVSGSLTLRN